VLKKAGQLSLEAAMQATRSAWIVHASFLAAAACWALPSLAQSASPDGGAPQQSPAEAGAEAAPSAAPPGSEKTGKTKALEAGAMVLQRTAPLGDFDIHLVGFHPMKDHPEHQMIAHHYCNQVNEDFAQCVLFDGDGPEANLNGIEYIISEKLFESLPEEERSYWHPHNGEILSGQLRAPGIPGPAEHALMKSKMNSYGKTWHVWNTGHYGQKADPMPTGPAMLAWSFSRDGEAIPELVQERDQKMDLDTQEAREGRQDLQELARPQWGVDTLHGQFKRPTKDIPGVVDAGK